ncbi:MAG: hypothetical protein NPIRA02_15940 [Nitrospirales bacterium]|nr:MAG: hypothetical protein NPIRA02_15940 [Nitrospirales bacterium]
MSFHPPITPMSSVLLVDDDPRLVPAAIDLLGLRGYLFETVKTGEEAITRVKRKSYGAVLLDLGVEEKNGTSIFHSLSQLDPLLPIVLLITETKAEKRSEFVKLGAFDLLRKPFEEQELQETLQRVASVHALRKIAQNTASGLMASTERYRSIVETARDAIILGDPDGNILSWNKAAELMFGYSAKDIVGQPLTRLMPARYREQHNQGLKRIRSMGEARAIGKTVELHGLKKGGEEFPIELSLSRSVESNEQFYCGIIRDVTSRKRAEIELLERNHILALDAEVGQVLSRNQELRALLQGCTEALVRHLDATFARIWTLNTTEQILELQASAGLYTHLNGSHARVPVGHLKIGKIAADKKPHLTNTVIGDPYVPEQEWAKREGLVAFAGFPLLSNQEVVGVMAMFSQHPLTHFTLNSLGMVADRITTAIEREIAHEAHLKSARHSEQILASAGEGIYGVDLDCKMTFVNPAGATILGYEAQELIGRSIHMAVHCTTSEDFDHTKNACPMCATLKNGEGHHVNNEVLWRKDRSSFPAEYTSTPIWENGRLTGAVVTFQDITERKRMAQQLLEEAKLAEVTRVLGDIAHDMKNMLMPVLNGATLIGEELQDHFASLPDTHRMQTDATRNFTAEALEMVINNTRRVHNRVREIAETVKGTINPPRFAPCLVSDVVNAVFESLRLYSIERGVSFHTHGLDSLPCLHADESRLFNALYNLVNNAIPETPSGGTVTISGETGPDPSIVMLTVADTGQGMPPEICGSLFTKEAISHKVGGTGLGTKIVKDTIDDHGGTITVHSVQGKGTTFTIQLPVNAASSEHGLAKEEKGWDDQENS